MILLGDKNLSEILLGTDHDTIEYPKFHLKDRAINLEKYYFLVFYLSINFNCLSSPVEV